MKVPRAQLAPHGGGQARLMPHNRAFTPILGDDAAIMGKVVAVIRRV